MQLDWRMMLGPALAMLIASASIYVDHDLAAFPNLSALYICVVALAGSLGGTASGLISAGIAVLAAAGLLGDDNATVADGSILLLILAAGGTALMTGLPRLQMMNALKRERERHATAARMSAALDQTDIGIVMLGADTRAEFINRAFRHYFSLPDEKADSKPPFIALMYHGRDTGAYELPQDELSHFIAERVGMVRAGDPTPINIKLRTGAVLRFVCTALPDGSRMLSYTPVTDLIRRTDNPADTDYYLSLRGGDRRIPIHRLRAAE